MIHNIITLKMQLTVETEDHYTLSLRNLASLILADNRQFISWHQQQLQIFKCI